MLFGRKTHKELETLYTAVRLEANNNYKDAAQEAYRRFEQRFIQLKEEGQLSDAACRHYGQLNDELKEALKGFSH